MEVQRSHISMYFMVILTALYPNLCSGADQTLNSVQSAKIPQQIHLSFGAQANDAVVVWATEGDEFGYVEYGSGVVPVKGVQGQKLELTEHSEKAVKFLHRAELSNLVRGTTYWYIIFSADSKVRSDNFTFRVPPKLSRVGHKFVVLADMGLLTRALQFMVHEILNGGYHAVFHIGDFAYNLDSEAGSIGDNYMRKISSFTARVPYMTTPGDHEKAYDFYHYRHRFSMPNAPWPMKEENLWYSINIGHTHFISISTQLDPGSCLGYMQRKWLKAAVNVL